MSRNIGTDRACNGTHGSKRRSRVAARSSLDRERRLAGDGNLRRLMAAIELSISTRRVDATLIYVVALMLHETDGKGRAEDKRGVNESGHSMEGHHAGTFLSDRANPPILTLPAKGKIFPIPVNDVGHHTSRIISDWPRRAQFGLSSRRSLGIEVNNLLLTAAVAVGGILKGPSCFNPVMLQKYPTAATTHPSVAPAVR